MDADDARLLKGCLDGKSEAWEAFTARFTPLLTGTCRQALRRLGRPCGEQEVADMVQETLAHLLEEDRRALRAYRGEAPLAGYLAMIAVYRVLKTRLPTPGAPPIRPEQPGPLETLEARERVEKLAEEASRLPPKGRLALALWSDGATLKEIGAAVGLSESAASRLLARAREQLRDRLES